MTDLANYRDEYVEGLQKVIEAKIAGQEIVAPTATATLQVVNLMDALKKSLDAVNTGKKKPAKATVAKREAKRSQKASEATGELLRLAASMHASRRWQVKMSVSRCPSQAV